MPRPRAPKRNRSARRARRTARGHPPAGQDASACTTYRCGDWWPSIRCTRHRPAPNTALKRSLGSGRRPVGEQCRKHERDAGNAKIDPLGRTQLPPGIRRRQTSYEHVFTGTVGEGQGSVAIGYHVQELRATRPTTTGLHDQRSGHGRNHGSHLHYTAPERSASTTRWTHLGIGLTTGQKSGGGDRPCRTASG